MANRGTAQPRKLPKQERSRQTVQALLEATARVLRAEGHGATTNRIAERAGVNIASLYQYFPNKESLVAALFSQHVERVLGVVVQGLADANKLDLPQAIEAVMTTFIRAHVPIAATHRLLLEQVPQSERLNPLIPARRSAVELVEGFLRSRADLRRGVDPKLMAFIVVHAVEAVVEGAVLDNPRLLEDPSFAKAVADLVRGFLVGTAAIPTPRS